MVYIVKTMIENYEHIIWDWNGTIFNDVDLSVSLINDLLAKYGLNRITRMEYLNYFTMPVKEYYARLGFDFSKYSFEIVGREWMDEYERRKFESGLYDGIKEILAKINSLNIGQSILSAYSQHTLDEMVDHYGLRSYFNFVFGLDNIYAASKMHQGKKLMEKLGNGKVLLIGDMIHDLEVANEIGADCLLLASGHQSYEKLNSLSAGFSNFKILPSINLLFA